MSTSRGKQGIWGPTKKFTVVAGGVVGALVDTGAAVLRGVCVVRGATVTGGIWVVVIGAKVIGGAWVVVVGPTVTGAVVTGAVVWTGKGLRAFLRPWMVAKGLNCGATAQLSSLSANSA